MTRLIAALAAIALPALAPAGFPTEETRGKTTIIHVVPDAGDEDEAYVRKVLRKAPTRAGVVHVFLRPGGDEETWGATFSAPKGLAYFISPGDYTAFRLDPLVPAVLALDAEGRLDARPIVKEEQTYAGLINWESLLDRPEFRADLAQANAQRGQPAIAGYDPTTYFDGQPAEGKDSITAEYRGVTYTFATEANRLTFDLDPSRFVPAYGGWCAWAMVDGEKVDVDPKTYKIVDGRLLLFYNGFLGNTLKKWNKGIEPELKKRADANWGAFNGRKPEWSSARSRPSPSPRRSRGVTRSPSCPPAVARASATSFRRW